jgi:uncharacterized protein YlzI (FlbEa/FlbD family)
VLVNGSGFISVTVSGEEVLLNVEHITSITKLVSGPETAIGILSGTSYHVDQTVSQVMEQITQVRALPPQRTP